MKFLNLALLVSLCACSLKSLEKYRADDYDTLPISYSELVPNKDWPSTGLTQCIAITGITPEHQVEKLNEKKIFHFQDCKKNPIVLRYQSDQESTIGVNQNAMRLKQTVTSMKGGNTVLAWLLLSSLSTTSEMAMAKGIVELQLGEQKFTMPFETNYIELNNEGVRRLENVVLGLTEDFIWQHLSPSWQQRPLPQKFDLKADYYEDIRWNIHHRDYATTRRNIVKAMETHPRNADLYFNRGLISEYERDYTAALADYKQAGELGYPLAKDSYQRVSTQMAYLEKIEKMNPGLRALRLQQEPKPVAPMTLN